MERALDEMEGVHSLPVIHFQVLNIIHAGVGEVCVYLRCDTFRCSHCLYLPLCVFFVTVVVVILLLFDFLT